MSNLTLNGRTLTESERLRYLADDETGREARTDMAIELADMLMDCKRARPAIVGLHEQLVAAQAAYAARDLRIRELQQQLAMPVTGAGALDTDGVRRQHENGDGV